MKMFEVGGCVRDEILGVPSKDIDFTVVLEGQETVTGAINPFNTMVNELKRMGFKIFLETPEFLTVRAQFPKTGTLSAKPERGNLTADFVLARKESTYTDGRRPDVVEPGTLEDDLARRDFKMNAIAKDADGNLIDPFNGQRDIASRIISAVGDPRERLTEDALRAVRAFRFSVTKGFAIETELKAAMESPLVLDAIINSISDERIDQELQKAFRFNTLIAGKTLFGKFPALAYACFAGNVSLDSTMKTKGRG